MRASVDGAGTDQIGSEDSLVEARRHSRRGIARADAARWGWLAMRPLHPPPPADPRLL